MLLKSARYKGLLRPVAERRLPGLGMKTSVRTMDRRLSGTSEQSRDGVTAAWPGPSIQPLATLGVVDGQALLADVCEPVSSQLVHMYALMSADAGCGAHARSDFPQAHNMCPL